MSEPMPNQLDLRARIADALSTFEYDQMMYGDKKSYLEQADALLSLPGIAVTTVPEPDEHLPDDSVLCQWLDHAVSTVKGSRRVRCYLEDHRMTSENARELGAALLAAAAEADHA